MSCFFFFFAAVDVRLVFQDRRKMQNIIMNM
jgi:hypothetical protein